MNAKTTISQLKLLFNKFDIHTNEIKSYLLQAHSSARGFITDIDRTGWTFI